MKEYWPIRTLGDVCDFERGLTYSKADEVETSANVVLRANNIDLSSGELDLSDLRYISDTVVVPAKKRVRQNSLLICTASGSRSHLGKVAFVDRPVEAAFGGFMGQITSRATVHPRFLFHMLMAPDFKEYLLGLTGGTNINNLRLGDVAKFAFRLPPYDEQQRIVDFLDSAVEGIGFATANTVANIEAVQRTYDHASAVLLNSGGVKWAELSLDEVCEISSRLVDPKLDQFLDLPHVGAGNMESRSGRLFDVLTAREEGLVSGKFLFEQGVVLYSKIRPYLMKACRPDFRGLCSADVYPLVPKPGKIQRDFLFHILMANAFTSYAELGSARAGMPKVNREHLFAYRFMAPPVAEQVEIAKRIDALATTCQSLSAHFNEKIELLVELRQSLLAHAFSGELTRKPLAA